MADKKESNNVKKSDINTNQNFLHSQNPTKIVSPTGLDRRGINVNNAQNFMYRSEQENIEREEILEEELTEETPRVDNKRNNTETRGFKGLMRGLLNSGKDKAKDEVRSKVIKLILAKYKWVILAIAAGLFLIVIVFFAVASGGGSTMSGISFNDVSQYKLGLKTEDPEYYKDFWEDTYESNIEPSNKKFYNRFKRVYNFYASFGPFSPGSEDAEKLEASKLHVLSTLFFDYSPDNFNSDINEWAAGKELDNIYLNEEISAYQICDNSEEADPNCVDSLNDGDYSTLSLLSIKLKETYEKYIKDMDSIRNLVRHLIIYRPVCTTSKELENGDMLTQTYKYNTYYSFDEMMNKIGEILLNVVSFKNPFSSFDEFQDCKGENNHWLNDGWDETEFNFIESVDFCAYYKYLAESDYFEKHTHFKNLFEQAKKYTTSDEQYQKEVKKIKIGLVEQIINIVALSNDNPIIYDSTTFAGAQYSNYTLSEDMYITLSNDRQDGDYTVKAQSLPIDQYVEGVLLGEVLGAFYNTGEDESAIYTALQANAIAIRSYALAVTKEGQRTISNGTGNQVFTDQYLKSSGSRIEAARKAALSTANQVLVENGKIIMAEYSSFNKEKNYYKEGDLCYTKYQKIGAKNNGNLHTVIAKCNWGLAGGHNRGMSQWGSLYLAINGYSYLDILSDFYSENTIVTSFDYLNKNLSTSQITNVVGLTEKMLVCSYGDFDIKIPARIVSPPKDEGDGGGGDGTSEEEEQAGPPVHLGKPLVTTHSCSWNEMISKDEDFDKLALLYRCETTGNGDGFITGVNGGTQDFGGAASHLAMPYAVVYQYGINSLNTVTGHSLFQNNGGRHNKDGKGNSFHRSGQAFDIYTGFFRGQYPEEFTNNRYGADGVVRWLQEGQVQESTDYSRIFYPTIQDADNFTVKDYYDPESGTATANAYKAGVTFTTSLYVYTDHPTEIPAALQNYLVGKEITNAFSAAGSLTDGTSNNVRFDNLTIPETSSGQFFDFSGFMSSLGWDPEPGTFSAEKWTETEAHHLKNSCNYTDMDAATAYNDYCCSGGISNTRSDYSTYNTTSTETLGGYFSDAWIIENCGTTKYGKKVLKQACFEKSAEGTDGCYEEVVDDDGVPILDKNGDKQYKLNPSKTVNRQYRPSDFVDGASSELRNITCSCSLLAE